MSEPVLAESPWVDDAPDCLVICCSDHRFERQTRELAQHLNFSRPHVVQVPSGAALSLPLVTAFGFISKAVDKIIERVIEMKKISDVILVGHQDCGAYKREKIPLVTSVVHRVTGKSVEELQRDHLRQAARRLHIAMRQVRVRSFLADVVTEEGEQRVRFTEIPVR